MCLSPHLTLSCSPVFAFAQHKVFRDPFDRRAPADEEMRYDPESVEDMKRKSYVQEKLQSRFSM